MSTASLLVIVLEADVVAWALHPQGTLENVVTAMNTLLNTHCVLRNGNSCAVVAAAPLDKGGAQLIFPVKSSCEEIMMRHRRSEQVRHSLGQFEGKLESFERMNLTVVTALQKVFSAQQAAQHYQNSSVPSALSKSLCYIHQCEKNKPIGSVLLSRILVIGSSLNMAADYPALMNCVFAAQKESILIDTCFLPAPTSSSTVTRTPQTQLQAGFLQQAADITGGSHVTVQSSTDQQGLIHYLMAFLLPDQHIRKTQTAIKSQGVDHRGSCFCHRKVVDQGLVCSMCLSVFCERSETCATCGTTFLEEQ